MSSEFILNASLSVISLLFIATLTSFFLRNSKIPYTVALVIVGLAMGFLASRFEFIGFLNEFKLSPELVFYVFLPTLIFESAFNLKFSHFKQNLYSITLLSTIGMLISTAIISSGMHYFLDFPWQTSLLFGSLISATDPIAVLALFKKIGAPKRLASLIEGESLFNDGTVLVLFGILASGQTRIITSFGHFLQIVVGGILVGTLLGLMFSKALDYVKNSKEIEISLTLILAHATFIIAEYFLGVSGIMATVFAGIVIGNYGAHKISYQVKEIMSHFWDYASYLANSLLFLMVGLIVYSSKDIALDLFKPLMMIVGLVLAARLIMVYGLLGSSNLFLKRKIPVSWMHIIQWGGLRGALAIALILTLPADTPFYQEMFIFTVGVIFFTLIVNGFTIKPLMTLLGLDSFSIMEEFQKNENQALIQHQVDDKLNQMFTKGFISKKIYKKLKNEYKRYNERSVQNMGDMFSYYGKNTSQETINELLYKHLLNVEKHAYKKLYYHGEITQEILNILLSNIERQTGNYREAEKIKIKRITFVDPDSILFKLLQKFKLDHLCKNIKKTYIMLRYEMYRARVIGSTAALKTLQEIETIHVFDKEIIAKFKQKYKKWHDNALVKIGDLKEIYPQICIDIQFFLAHQAIYHTEEKTLQKLYQLGLTSDKIFNQIKEEMESRQKETHKYWRLKKNLID